MRDGAENGERGGPCRTDTASTRRWPLLPGDMTAPRGADGNDASCPLAWAEQVIVAIAAQAAHSADASCPRHR